MNNSCNDNRTLVGASNDRFNAAMFNFGSVIDSRFQNQYVTRSEQSIWDWSIEVDFRNDAKNLGHYILCQRNALFTVENRYHFMLLFGFIRPMQKNCSWQHILSMSYHISFSFSWFIISHSQQSNQTRSKSNHYRKLHLCWFMDKTLRSFRAEHIYVYCLLSVVYFNWIISKMPFISWVDWYENAASASCALALFILHLFLAYSAIEQAGIVDILHAFEESSAYNFPHVSHCHRSIVFV